MKKIVLIVFGLLLLVLSGVIIYTNRELLVTKEVNLPVITNIKTGESVKEKSDDAVLDTVFKESDSADYFDDIVI